MIAALTRAEAAIADKLWKSAQRGRPVPVELRRALEGISDGDVAQSAATFARRVIVLDPLPGKSVPVGAARFGGAPDLSLKTGWPEADGVLLSFVLQVPVEDVLLSWFAGSGEHVVLALDPKSLQRRPVPSNVTWRVPELGLLPIAPLQPRPTWALPPVGSDEFLAIRQRHPELDPEAYGAAVSSLVPRGSTRVFGFAEEPSHERGRKKLRPLLSAALPAVGTVDVFSPTGARFGRGPVRGTEAALSHRPE